MAVGSVVRHAMCASRTATITSTLRVGTSAAAANVAVNSVSSPPAIPIASRILKCRMTKISSSSSPTTSVGARGSASSVPKITTCTASTSGIGSAIGRRNSSTTASTDKLTTAAAIGSLSVGVIRRECCIGLAM